MNEKTFVLIAPIFPYTFFQFAKALKHNGFRVLAIGDAPYDHLAHELRENIQEYYYEPQMSHYDHLKRAFGYFVAKYGRIDYVESNIEFWLGFDARLREDFDIPNGMRPQELNVKQQKSGMKKFYRTAGIPVAEHAMVQSIADAQRLVKEVGYPLFIKPNIGVGATTSFKVTREKELVDVFAQYPAHEWILERFIDGDIISYDGICNEQSEVVFQACHLFYQPISDLVNSKEESVYLSLPQVPKDLEAYGKATVKAFGLKRRFFHLEFFRLKRDHPGLGSKGALVALEANLRVAGGYTAEMMNYAHSVNTYQIYADVIAFNENRQKMDYPKYYCIQVSRRDGKSYRYPWYDVLQQFKDGITFTNRYPWPISTAMGDDFLLAKFKTQQEVDRCVEFALMKSL